MTTTNHTIGEDAANMAIGEREALNAALDKLGDDKGQGLDPFWKSAFREGWEARAALTAEKVADARRYRWLLNQESFSCDHFRWAMHRNPQEVDTVVDQGLERKMHKLPDGSGFFTASLPLPSDHWLYAPRCAELDDARDTTADTPHPILTHEQRDAVVAAVRYAIRGATMCGKESDFDPDALVQNAVYALCGPYGFDVVQAEGEPK